MMKRLNFYTNNPVTQLLKNENRNELCFIAQGKARISNDQGSVDASEYETFKIPANDWHQLENIGSNILHVVEIQHGSNCQESYILNVNSC
jgi:mannose-6-phosphate isomerase-like protein (cupin superfamily)